MRPAPSGSTFSALSARSLTTPPPDFPSLFLHPRTRNVAQPSQASTDVFQIQNSSDRGQSRKSDFSRKACAEIRRGFSPNEVLGELCGGFLGGFFRAFSLRKTGGNNPPKNPRQNSNQNLGVSRPKSTPQGSGLENFMNFRGPGLRAEENVVNCGFLLFFL